MCKQLPNSATVTHVLNECSDIYGTNQNFFNETFSAPSEIVPKLEYFDNSIDFDEVFTGLFLNSRIGFLEEGSKTWKTWIS